VVRFNMRVQIIAVDGLPGKYSTFEIRLQKGQKRICSGELLADDERKMVRDTSGAATLHFVSSMRRAASGIDFEDKTYKLYLLGVNPRAVMHRTKVVRALSRLHACTQACTRSLAKVTRARALQKVAETQINLAEACTRNGIELRLAMDAGAQSGTARARSPLAPRHAHALQPPALPALPALCARVPVTRHVFQQTLRPG
jgi:hypothetical protein